MGCILNDSRKDDADIKRQLRQVYSKGNSLVHKFKPCTESVKAELFECTMEAYNAVYYGPTIASLSIINLLLHTKEYLENCLTCRLGLGAPQALCWNENVIPCLL